MGDSTTGGAPGSPFQGAQVIADNGDGTHAVALQSGAVLPVVHLPSLSPEDASALSQGVNAQAGGGGVAGPGPAQPTQTAGGGGAPGTTSAASAPAAAGGVGTPGAGPQVPVSTGGGGGAPGTTAPAPAPVVPAGQGGPARPALPPPSQPQVAAPTTPKPAGSSGPSYTSQYDKAVKGEQDANTAAAQAEAAANTAKTDAQAKIAQGELEGLRTAQAKRDAVMQGSQQRLAEIDQMSQDLAKSAPDPNRLLQHLTVGQGVAATIAEALHGFSDGFQGKTTTGPLEKAIQRDIDQQRAQYESKKDLLSSKQNAYRMYREQGLSDAEASAQLTHDIASASQNMLGQWTQGADNARILANAGKVNAALQPIAVEAKSKLATEAQNRAANAVDLQLKQYQLAQLTNPNRALRDGEVKVGGKIYNVGDKSFEKIRTSQTIGDSMREAIKTMKEELAKGGTSSDLTESGSRYRAALERFQTAINTAEGVPGVVGESQRKGFEESLKPQLLKPSKNTAAALDVFDKGIVANVNGQHRAAGLPDYFADADKAKAAVGFAPLKPGG